MKSIGDALPLVSPAIVDLPELFHFLARPQLLTRILGALSEASMDLDDRLLA
jgi:hypothetical protein